MESYGKVSSYEEAVEIIRSVGILPLADLIPDHPSLCSITKDSDWHSGTEMDPWLWRVRFPGDGVAAYGKFFKKKAIFIASEIVPLVKAIVGSETEMRTRYTDGALSSAALRVYELIKEQPGIDTRTLRAQSGLKATDQKKEYDQAITDLQASMDIVISGVKERLNSDGDKNGWNSTSFETTSYWLEQLGIDSAHESKADAKEKLQAWLEPRYNPASLKYISKLLGG